jgi:hypothetical protein
MKMRLFPRAILVLSALLVLLAALWAGLIRMGWDLPPIQVMLPLVHGPLMVCGFLGALIGLERAVALAAPTTKNPLLWPYLSPILTGLGGLALLIGLEGAAGPTLIALGSLVMVAVFGVIIHRQPALFTVTMGAGALAWLIGNVFWLLGQPIYGIVLWWMGFPLLTIVGERLELSRLAKLSMTSQNVFGVSCGIFLVGAMVSMVNLDMGTRVAGVGMMALAIWLARYDIARHTVRRPGLTRFIALCLLAGYAWLGFSGLLALLQGGVFAGPSYDAMLHSLFVGFAFSMIFGHAPIILPAILGVPLRFHRIFYLHLGLLHFSLLMRLTGDLTGSVTFRQWGGMLNAIALLLFLSMTVWGIRSRNPPGLTEAKTSPSLPHAE